MIENTKLKRRPQARAKIEDSFLVKYGLKFFLGITVIMVFLTAVQCSIKKPEAPTWNTSLTIPLVNRTYTMSEIIEKIDQPGLELNDNGDIMFSFEEELDTIAVNGNLSTADISQSFSEVLGQIVITPNDPAPAQISLSDYISLVLGAIPNTSFDITADIPTLSSFNWADVATGIAYVQVTNNFGLDLDTVIVQVIDLSDMSAISTATFPDPGIPDGITDSVAINLGGQRISNQFRLQIHCHTPGAGSFSLSPDKVLIASMDFGNGLTISAAEAKTPAINLNFSQQVALSDSNTIISAELSSGDIQIVVQNNSNLPASIVLSLDDFNLGGQSLSINRNVSAQATEIINVDLTGYLFEPLDQSVPQKITVDVSASIDSSTGWVVVDENHSFQVTADITNLNFASMTGVIKATSVSFDGIQVNVDLPQGFDSLQLVNAILVLEVENTLDFPGTLDLTIQGDGGQSLNLSGSIAAGTALNPAVSFIIDSSVASFLNPVPSIISVNGSASFGDGVSVGTITANDYIFSKISVTSPMEVIIDRVSFASDTASEKINQEDIDIITEHMVSADFSPVITNHLPLGVEIEIYLDGDSTRLNANQAQLVIGPLQISAGEVGPGGVVIAATNSELLITLDSLDVQVLNNDYLYSTQSITIIGDGLNPIKLTGTDYLTIQGVIEVEYKFDGEF